MAELNRDYLIREYGKDNLFNRTEIILDFKQFKKIDCNTFKGLSKLEKLSLRNCRIEEIDEGSFETLTNLKVLEIYNNNLKRIDSNTFEGIGNNLEKLSLNSNAIEQQKRYT